MGINGEREHPTDEITALKRERGAIILVHNYQPPEVQDLADFCGDSLGLAQQAAATDAAVIVLCGVEFMAETAKLLNPAKRVLLAAREAGCPMAEMVKPEDIRELRDNHAGAVVVSYVNTTAAVKAVSDICCTSANAAKVVNAVPPDKPVIFTPDRNLGAYVESRTGRKLIIWPGCCPTHAAITAEMVRRARVAHPGAEVVVHPECEPDVIALADAVRSTSGMLDYCAASPAPAFIIGTEEGMLYPLRRRCPTKQFWPVGEGVICPNMKLTTPGHVRDALRYGRNEISVAPDVAPAARRAIERMLEVGRDGAA
jgi:quinolinate synthase